MSAMHVVCLPGWGMSSQVFEPIIRHIDRDFILHFVDWVGIETLSGFSERVITYIATLDAASVALLGWSLGSIVAVEAALKSSRVDRLLLFGATFSFVDEDKSASIGWPKRVLERMKRQLKIDREETMRNFYKMMFSSQELDARWLERWMREFGDIANIYSIEELLLGLDYLIKMDLSMNLGALRAKIMIVQGAEDKVCPIGNVQASFDFISSQKRLVAMPGVGHVPFYTQSTASLQGIWEMLTS